jgi:hypothetical protein
MFREMIQETNTKRVPLIKEILRKVLPEDKSHQQVFPKMEPSEQTPSDQTPKRLFEVPSISDT